MNKILIIICCFILISCKKENDVLRYKLEFTNPYPADKSVDVPLRGVYIGFGNVIREGLANYVDYINGIATYFDTINPPKHSLQTYQMQIMSLSNNLPMLKPYKTYYWAFTTFIPPGEMWSDIESFTTCGFNGDWQLDGIADKKGNLEMNQALGYKPNWLHWSEWTDRSYKYIQDGSPYGKVIEYIPNKDSILEAGFDINEIVYNSPEYTSIKFYKGNYTDYLTASFNYDENKGIATIQETQTKILHNFVAVNVGYMQYYNKVVLLMVDEKGIMFIYSRKSK